MIPQFTIKRGKIGNEIFIVYPDLKDYPQTTISTATTAGSTTALTVQNNSFFSSNDYIVIEDPGNELTEIKQISSVSGSTTITVSSAVSFSHPLDTIIRYIPFNRIEIQRSTDSGVNYSSLATISIRLDDSRKEQYYQHAAGASTDYYRVRYNNQQTSDNSSFSDGLIATGYADNSVYSIK